MIIAWALVCLGINLYFTFTLVKKNIKKAKYSEAYYPTIGIGGAFLVVAFFATIPILLNSDAMLMISSLIAGLFIAGKWISTCFKWDIERLTK